MSNLKAYLAEKYMSGPKADAILSKTAPLKKKRKAKDVTEPRTGGTMIRDEDGGWGEAPKEDNDDDITEAVVEKDRGFKKRKVANAAAAADSSWITVQEGVGGMQVKEESPAPDEKPMVVDTPFVGGLVRPEHLKRMLPQNNVTITDNLTAEEIARAQETVYRDSAGKKIDTKAARAEAARLKRLQEEKEAQKMEWGKGLVQKEEAEKRRKQLEKNKTTAFARHADDKELNEELKAKELWNDPAAAFLTKKKAKGPRKPEYIGPPPPPNRFGIKPGYRWDGVDRGTGFEKKLFESKNAKRRLVTESYQWGVDDM
ncbi:Pre-mRNA-splicing factor of RES complex-domain-containing protein [Flammula alnicola]|nr:Pre-mRNA-splicing factor of RES complex-domain-containing protein [Flammula alnicola]